MPIHVFWDNDEKAVIQSEGEGYWTWDEFHQAFDQVVVMMKSVPHRVDLINNRGTGSRMPSSSPMPHFQRVMRNMPPNAGMMVMISNSAFGRVMVNLFSKVRGSRRLFMVASLDEARALIANERAKQAGSARR